MAVPAAVHAEAADERISLVWENELGGLTFELGSGASRRFIKWAPAAIAATLAEEVQRLRWAAQFISVPDVIAEGRDDAGAWFTSKPLDGESAVARRWLDDPERAVTAIGRGLRKLHDALPVDQCPFTYSWPGPDPDPAPPAVDKFVVCHGDACSPNTILGERGEFVGHVDVDALGIADRWADLAIATWSCSWNYGAGWEDLLLDAYGIAPDSERTRYYRTLWGEPPDWARAS